MHRIAKLAAVVVTAAAFSAPATAQAGSSFIYNSYSYDAQYIFVSWGKVVVCDGDRDGNSVKAHYTRDDGVSRSIHEERGYDNCSHSEASTTNRVTKHRSQQIRDWATDPYGPWVYRV
ncbi:hypothetical protein H4W23_04400 [Streptomyces gardneri]|uniref:hypothetical protein n=1 Tax=Streptomyces gardneri TaxID=66892 RepID=UPI0006E36436|nr:hypothetical protein [Streptomyces gardneri]QPK43927.1 hypothetical protein H4W23_04400 [Streptomyces gardneri]WRK35193.1 hypothetical protein U0M97_04425 [Streptomyces venezuelae]